ncbi:MAG: carboxymuconolactone decarboxylase family protein [Burkholderiales bacterium]|nr:carboxymuconolactone decarboxylase family protein [Burkholderiales bacterium]
MPRLNVVKPEQAAGPTKALYDAIERAVGGVPNIYQGIGNSAAALGAVLHVDHALKSGRLSAAEIEAIKLVVSESYGCDYCLAAHSLLGKKAGLADAELVAIRRGASGHPRIGALVNFVRGLIHPQARVSDEDLRAVQAAGYDDAQIAESLLTIAQTVFTNLFNRVHRTPLDFPAAPSL